MWHWFTQDFWPHYGSNGWSLEPLTYREIQAWRDLLDEKPTPEEIRLLKSLDFWYRGYVAEKTKTKGKASETVVREIDVSDGIGIRSLMAGFKKKQAVSS